MFKEKAMELADALESGKFKQGKFFLGRNMGRGGEYCCLGVACELSKQEWSAKVRVYLMEGVWDRLPYSVRNEFDMFCVVGSRMDEKPLVINGEKYDSLAHANDSGVTFKEIAAYIRKNYQYL